MNMKHIKTALSLLACWFCIGMQAQKTTTSENVFSSADPFEQESPQKSTKASHTLSASVAPGWITSKVATPYDEYSWRLGMGYELGYRCLFHNGYGFGLNYAHSSTHYPGGYQLGLNYAGASFVYGGHISSQWIATFEIGLGYANYTDGGTKVKDGLGSKYGIGIEYQLSNILGIGIGLTHYVQTFSKDNNGYYDSDKYVNGFKRFGLNAGIKIYL